MSKLDEIEARATTIAVPQHPLSAKIQADFGLLIRAVRQQSAVIRAAMKAFDTDDWSMYSTMSAQLDPDVLELIADD